MKLSILFNKVYKNYSLLFFIPFLLYCGNNSVKSIKDSSYIQKESIQPIDTCLYIRIGNPDTALVFFLWRDYLNNEFSSSIEEYSRWDLENKKIKKMILKLYHSDKEINQRLNLLEKKKKLFYNIMKDTISARFNRKINFLDDLEFDYFYKKKDTFYYNILNKVINSKEIDPVFRDESIKLKNE